MKYFTQKESDLKELKKFALIMTFCFGVVFGIILPLILHKPFPRWPHYLWSPLLFLAWVYPPALTLAYNPWMKLGHALGYVNSRIILSVVFYFLFTPIALLRKILGKDSMGKNYQKEVASYRKLAPEDPRLDHMQRPF